MFRVTGMKTLGRVCTQFKHNPERYNFMHMERPFDF